ncbi:Piso0_001100 [Millerozyma farinosa CBS 7064]|uniref:Piso0_001100 protein n=1 Tax=Pichia sorbitophila (strain ATCC MYA-4447 / BCRC 22081 / CBS 7064 / NBRC 10061 / NRRL Y-12695) TaxID=559304 RepID=G8YQX8_PICSO|nr:Piso0_001100 [Millerozyma farinosa CBS 7064]CCE79063.1 Piso0_001100 [Millerozyma farinosa CBS 7064]
MIGTDSYHIVVDISEQLQQSFDYRWGKIEVTVIDNPSKIKTSNFSKMAKDSIEPLKAKFLGEGVVRLYREFVTEDIDRNKLPQSITSALKNKVSSEGESRDEEDTVNPCDDTMVAITALPVYFTATDLLAFMGDTYVKYITHLRILKSEKPNRFLVLIKFNDIVKTAEFQYKYNGKTFTAMDPEPCHVIFVKSVRYNPSHLDRKTSQDRSDPLIPFLLSDPFTASSTQEEPSELSSSQQGDTVSIELPTCPVCLEKLDSTITGLLTIPCQHTFHCSCLSKWKDDTCPVCRYSNSISNQKVRQSVRRMQNEVPTTVGRDLFATGTGASTGNSLQLESGVSNSTDIASTEKCFDCDMNTNLWVCLICGNVGCDRYAPDQHSLKHFVNSGHCFAMELNSSRVWDYVGDTYVHRLLTNEADGKLVELPEKESYNSPNNNIQGYGAGSTSSMFKSNRGNSNYDKVDEVGFEYSQLLISQLASQREYYESLLKQKGIPAPSETPSALDKQNNSQLESKVETLAKTVADLTDTVIPNLNKKLSTKDEKIQKLSRELNEALSLNEGLSSKVEYLTERAKDLEVQKNDLAEQVNDLMFYLENQEKFKDRPQEEKEGTIVLQPGSSSSRKSRNKKKK